MSDDTRSPEGQPDPIAAPAVDEDAAVERGRAPWPRVVVITIICALLLAGCAFVVAGIVWGTPVSRPVLRRYPADALAWADSGRLAVLQSWDRSGVPYVAAWEPGRAPSVARGFRTVAVEPAAARVWVVRDDGTRYAPGADTPTPDVMIDDVDAVPETLLLWDLSKQGSRPAADAEARWAPWKGPSGVTAFPEIDPAKGALPSGIRFQGAAGGEGVKAALPADVVTFVPLGWSPSGRFFAVQALGRLERPWDNSVDADGAARPIIIDAATGQVAADESRESVTGQGWPWAVWGPERDRLFFAAYMGVQADGETPAFKVQYLDPDRSMGYLGDGGELPAELARTADLRVQGGAPGPVEILAAGEREWTVYRYEGSETVRACVLPVWAPPVASADTGMFLGVDYQAVHPEARLSVYGRDGELVRSVRPLQ